MAHNDIQPGSDQTESAAQIHLNINGEPHRVKSVDHTTEVDVEMVYGNQLTPSGWAVNEVSYSGSLSFHGDVAGEINPKLTASDGVTPTEGNTLTVTHLDGTADKFQNVFLTQTEYSMSESDVTETNYEWVAMEKNQPQ